MFGLRRRFLSFPLVIGAAVIGVVSGKSIFGPPLEEYWKNKLQEDAAAAAAEKKTDAIKIGVVSGKSIFGPPLEEYWKNKLQEDAAAAEKKTDASPSSS